MTHHANPRFWQCYRALPAEIRELADRNYEILKTNPSHASLHFKKIGVLWSVRVGLHYRALATQVEADLVWFWIGSHAEYDRLVGRKPTTKTPKPAQRARKQGAKSRSGARRG